LKREGGTIFQAFVHTRTKDAIRGAVKKQRSPKRKSTREGILLKPRCVTTHISW